MSDIKKAVNELTEELTLVIVKDNKIVISSSDRGIYPLYNTVETMGNDLNGSSLADKVIGKAAAMLAVSVGINDIYGRMMSQSAKDYIMEHGGNPSYEKLVSGILNRTKDGSCPVEAMSMKIDDIDELKSGIKAFLTKIGVL